MKTYRLPRGFLLIVLLVLLLLAGGGTWFFFAQRQLLKENINNDLMTIAENKAQQIVTWRSDQTAEGKELMQNQFLLREIAAWQASGSLDNLLQIRSYFETLQTHYNYSNILLVNPQGQVLICLKNDLTPLDSEAYQSFNEAMESGKPLLSDLHIGSHDQNPHISVIAPLAIVEGGSEKPLGAIILVNDARDFLYPLIQSWPTGSISAETLLIERDGDSVLFLNDLRHQKDTALKLRFKLTEADLPAAAVVLGHTGIFSGKDYRDVEVLSAVLPITNSPWFIVAKMDTSEALAVWRTNSTLIVAMVLGLLGIAAGSAMVFWQRDEKRYYFKLAAIEAARRESEARHRVTLMSVGDGVIVTDKNGIVQLLNPVAEALTGWTETEARGKSLKKVFQIINEDTRKPVENPVTKVIREGMVIGLANHTVLKARDGSLKPIADSGAPIRDEKGEISGVVLVFRDQTEERDAKRKLEESEEKFRLYFEDATIGISLTETNGKLSTINKAFCEMLGYSKEELTKKGFAEITHPDDLAESRECVRLLLAGERSTYRMEKRYIKKNGDILWADVSTMLLRDADGKPLHFITNVIDISKRKAAQKALESSEAYIKNVLDNLPIGVSVNSVFPTVTFGYFNENFLKFYRITRESLSKPDSFWEAAYEEPVFRAKIKKRILDGCASENPKLMVWDDIPITRKGQETTYISARNIPISGNNQMVSIVWDTTHRKKYEQELKKSEEKLIKAQQVAHIGSWTWNIKTNELEWSDEMYRVFGIEKSTFSGNLADVIASAIHPDDRAKVEKSNLSVIREKKPIPLEYRVIWPDGSIHYVWAEAGEFVLDETGNPERLTGIAQDITIRKQAEAEIRKLNTELERRVEERTAQLKKAQEQLIRQEKLAVLGQLAGGVSHELRNPLGVISNAAYLLGLLLPKSDEKTREYISIIDTETHRAEKIITDLLDFSRVKSAERIAFKLHSQVKKNLELIRIPENVTLEIKFPESLPDVFADPSQIDLVIGNLLENACQAMAKGGRLILTGNEKKQKEKLFVALEVRDTGSGITPENLARIFEPLFTTKQRGIGLGLATSKNLVEGNGGWMEVSSIEGKGSRFAVYLPTVEDKHK